MKHLGHEFYLVKDNGKNFIVVVSENFLESRELKVDCDDKKFTLDNWIFTNCGEIHYK